MKKFIIPVVAVALVLAFSYCGKGGGGGGGCSEPAMVVASIPANNSTELPAPGPDFEVQVNITSGKPQQGVNIEVKAREESKTTPFYTSGLVGTTSATTNLTITGTPSGVSCVVEITVTSKSCATNKATLKYTYSRK